MKYFSMFSGIGGFEYGIEKATNELECIGFSEIDKYATAIYKYHYPDHRAFGDATAINVRELPDFELLVGGFPCQAFSFAGKRRGFNDSRGTLFFEIARILSNKRPRHFILENVKGLLSHEDGKTFRTILGILADIGYEYQWQVFNSKDFGVPQNRERVFIIGHLRGECKSEVFPIGEINSVNEEIQPEQNRKKTGSSCLSTRYGQRWTDETYVMIQRPHGFNKGGEKDLPCLRGSSMEQNEFIKHTVTGGLQDHAVTMTDKSTALTGAMGQGGGHTPIVDNIRRLTPTECERLQAFPDNWTQYGIIAGKQVEISDSQRYKCIGNSVTTTVITEIIKKLDI